MACASFFYPCDNHILHRNVALDEMLTSVSQSHVIGKRSVAVDEDGRIYMRKDSPCGYEMGVVAFLACANTPQAAAHASLWCMDVCKIHS